MRVPLCRSSGVASCSPVRSAARPASRSATRGAPQPDRPLSGPAAAARSPIPIFAEAGSTSRKARATTGSVGAATAGAADDSDEDETQVVTEPLPGFGVGRAGAAAVAGAAGAQGVLVKDILDAEQQLQVMRCVAALCVLRCWLSGVAS